MSDVTEALVDAVRRGRDQGQRMLIMGGGSKRFVASADTEPVGRILSTEEHTGIEDYRPDELVVTVRSGTPLKVLRQTLAREGQMLGFEPPEFQGLGTAGGAVAAGLAGPGRPWRGGVRDSVLGVVMINGLGERLTFGGQVMKNVAGFDVSRLQAGAFGTFGVLLSVSLKVLPVPQTEETRVLGLDREAAHQRMIHLGSMPLPVTASAWVDGRLYLRLSGAEPAVLTAAKRLGGEPLTDSGFWGALRDHALPFFKHGSTWCRHVPPAAPLTAGDELIDWQGARRWSSAPGEGQTVFRRFGTGYARFRCRDAGGDPVLAGYQRRLKQAFDPDNLFNAELTDADVAA